MVLLHLQLKHEKKNKNKLAGKIDYLGIGSGVGIGTDQPGIIVFRNTAGK